MNHTDLSGPPRAKHSPMLRTETSTLGILITTGELALSAFRPVRDAQSALDDAVFASHDGAEAFAGTGGFERGGIGWEVVVGLLGKLHLEFVEWFE